MQNFLNKVFSLAKKGIFVLLIALTALSFLGMIFNAVVGGVSAGFALAAVFCGLAQVFAFAFGLFSWIKKKSQWFKLFSTVYFSFYFLNTLFYAANAFCMFCGALMVLYALFSLIFSVAVVAVGVLVITDYLNGTEKFAKIINYMLAGMACVLALVFIFDIIAVCAGDLTWNAILTPVFDFAVIALFCGLFNFNREFQTVEGVKRSKPVKAVEDEPEEEQEEKAEQQETPSSEVKEEPAEEKEEEKKEEQPAEEEKDAKEEKSGKRKKSKKAKNAPAPVEEKPAEENNYIPVSCPKCGERKVKKISDELAVCDNCGAKLKISKKSK